MGLGQSGDYDRGGIAASFFFNFAPALGLSFWVEGAHGNAPSEMAV